MLSAQLGLASELVDWYRDATSVLYGHLLIDLLPRTDNWLRYWTNRESISSKFYVPEGLKHWKFLWTKNTKNFSTLQVFQSVSHKCKRQFIQCCPNELIRFLCECIKMSAQRKSPKPKKRSRGKISKRNSIVLSKKGHLEARKRGSAIRKRVTTHKIFYSSRRWPFILIWCSLFSFLLLCTTITRVWILRELQSRNSKVSSWTKFHVPNWFALKWNKQKHACQSRLFSQQNFV